MRPHRTGSQTDGLTFTGIKSGSIFRKMGLRNGDIVQAGGGKDIRSPKDMVTFYNEMESNPDITLEIKRRGRKRVLKYKFR